MKYQKWPSLLPTLLRFQLKVWPRGDCWEFRGTQGTGGYRLFTILIESLQAHRFAYVVAKGAVPKSLQLDHICRHRWCVRPSHLEAVTAKVNTNRGSNWNTLKTHCPQGHPYNVTYWRRSGPYAGSAKRQCTICQSRNKQARKARVAS